MCTLGTVADTRVSVGKKNMASSSGCAMTKIAVETEPVEIIIGRSGGGKNYSQSCHARVLEAP